MKLEISSAPKVSGAGLFRSLVPTFRKIASSVPRKDDLIEVNLVGRRKITQLNENYKNRTGSAEILTFDYGDDGFSTADGNLRGEIYIYFGGVSRSAGKLGVSEKAYLLRLFVHGICHLLGYEHGKEEEAKRMEEVEKKLLRPYLSKGDIDAMF